MATNTPQEPQTPVQKLLHNFAGSVPRGQKTDGTGIVKEFKIKEVELNPANKMPVSMAGTIKFASKEGDKTVENTVTVRWNVQGACSSINDAGAQNPLFDLVEKVSV
jgi:hypothetical protein